MKVFQAASKFGFCKRVKLSSAKPQKKTVICFLKYKFTKKSFICFTSVFFLCKPTCAVVFVN